MGLAKNVQFFIHKHYEGIKLALLAFIAILATLTFLNVNRAVEQITEDNDRSHARTQQYARCLLEAILVPLAERDNIDFDNCTVTEDDSPSADPNPTEAAPSAPTPYSQSSVGAPRAQENVSVEPRPPEAPRPQIPVQQPPAPVTPATPAPATEQPRGLVPAVLDVVTGTVNGVVGGVRGVLGL